MKEYVKGLVSVIIPTYRRSEKLIRAIESVLRQTYTNLELLVVNDNIPGDEYSDELVRKTKKYISDQRFHLIFQKKHINGAAARNEGIRQAKGEYIAFLDDDDWWHHRKLEIQVNILSKLDSDWGGVSCKIKRCNNNKVIAKLPRYRSGYVYKDILMLQSDFATGTLLLRHQFLDNAGYYDESLKRHQDLQLLVSFTSKYKLLQIDKFLHYCDVSDASNRLDGEQLIETKKAFFASVNPIMLKLNEKERKIIYALNDFEVGYVFLKNKKYLIGLKYSLLALRSPVCAYYCMKKCLTKIKTKIV